MINMFLTEPHFLKRSDDPIIFLEATRPLSRSVGPSSRPGCCRPGLTFHRKSDISDETEISWDTSARVFHSKLSRSHADIPFPCGIHAQLAQVKDQDQFKSYCIRNRLFSRSSSLTVTLVHQYLHIIAFDVRVIEQISSLMSRDIPCSIISPRYAPNELSTSFCISVDIVLKDCCIPQLTNSFKGQGPSVQWLYALQQVQFGKITSAAVFQSFWNLKLFRGFS